MSFTDHHSSASGLSYEWIIFAVARLRLQDNTVLVDLEVVVMSGGHLNPAANILERRSAYSRSWSAHSA